MASTDLDGVPRGEVAVGASARGVEALTRFAAGLPPDLPYAIAIVLYMPANAPSVSAKIIDRNGPLPAVSARNGAAPQAGDIHVGVPDRYLLIALIADGRSVLSGPTENGYRPASNALFRSAALSFGLRSIGVLLLDDGVLGTAGIRAMENRIAMGRRFSTTADAEKLGPHSGYTCPACNGSLMTVSEGNYRCRVRHAWTADALLDAHDDEVDGALWVALRSLQEKAKLSRKPAEKTGSGTLFKRHSQVADEAERALTILGKRLSVAGEHGGG